jgi:hypothetical protein
MRILLWHGWLLEGSGSNVATARVAERYRAAGHDVLLVCQERHPERRPCKARPAAASCSDLGSAR